MAIFSGLASMISGCDLKTTSKGEKANIVPKPQNTASRVEINGDLSLNCPVAVTVGSI